ncbi:MAG: tetratricopeptide repeat protein, partial [Pseudomonadota bacterium]
MPALIATSLDATRPHPGRTRKLSTLSATLWVAFALLSPQAQAEEPATDTPTTERFQNSRMDGALFYQLLVGELQARGGEVGSAYQIYLELARRHRNPELFKRTIEIALQARAGDQALTAAKAWRQAQPQSRDAAEYQIQILLLMGRSTDLAEPLKAFIQLAATPQQPQLIAALPRTLSRLPDRKAAAQVIDEVTQPWRLREPALAEAWIASGEAWLAAKDDVRALEATRKAHSLQPQSLSAGLLALNLIDTQPQAEELLRRQLSRPDASPLLRLAFARKLAGLQRMSDAAHQLEIALTAQPDDAGAWLTLAAVQLEQQRPDQAEIALNKFMALKASTTPSKPPSTTEPEPDASLDQAYLLLSQMEEQRGQWNKALGWLQRLDKTDNLLVQSHRARLLAKQGKLDEGRAAIRGVPESEPRDALGKYQTEAQLLREIDHWEEAFQVLGEANQRFPDDADLIYDQAMVAEHLHKFEAMETLLRKAIQLKPDNANPYNALGYSLADRNVRLDEARKLIDKALALRPGDPFITDSLGWLEFRSGRMTEALSLLRQ